VKNTPSWLTAFLSVLLAEVIWSTSFVATKIALQGFPPFTLAALRMALATLVLGCFAIFSKDFERPKFPDLLRLSAGGFVGLTVYFCLENYGVKFTSASDAVLLVAVFPVITLLLDSLLFHAPLSGMRLAGSCVAIFGVFLIVRNGSEVSGHQRILGDCFMILAGVMWALYTFATKSVIRKYSMITVNFYQNLVATIMFVPFIFF